MLVGNLEFSFSNRQVLFGFYLYKEYYYKKHNLGFYKTENDTVGMLHPHF